MQDCYGSPSLPSPLYPARYIHNASHNAGQHNSCMLLCLNPIDQSMSALGSPLLLPTAISCLHGGRCSELPSLQRSFLAANNQNRVRTGQALRPVMVVAQQTATLPQLRIFRGQDLESDQLHSVLARPRIDFESILQTVSERWTSCYLQKLTSFSYLRISCAG